MSDGPKVLEEIRARLGAEVVLLPIPRGKKAPLFDRWQDVSPERAADPDFEIEYCSTDKDTGERICFRRENYAQALERAASGEGNIGVLLRGNLAAIDIDADGEVDAFLRLNPQLRGTLISKGKRGVQIWVRLLQDPKRAELGLASWPAMNYLKRMPDPAAVVGKSAQDAKKLMTPWGEWRTAKRAGAQSVIWGAHPDGPAYQWVQDAPVLEINFADINWPENLYLPWKLDEWAALADLYGAPWTAEGGVIETPTELFWAARFASETHLIFEEEEESFYQYRARDGAWHRVSDEKVKVEIGAAVMRWRHDPYLAEIVYNPAESALPGWRRLRGGALAELETNRFRSHGRLTSIACLLKGLGAVRKRFQTGTGIIHLANGMLDLRERPLRLRRFSPYYYSRNQIPIPYVKRAKAVRFLEELAIALPAEDIDLLQRWAGLLLLGRNVVQKFVILSGTPGGGKSTILKIFQNLVGLDNCVQMRHDQLGERFELFNYIGKTFLAGVDVPGHFLNTRGGYVIKGLTGGDLMTAEGKGLKGGIQLEGNFNLGITCNGRLKVRLDSDNDAWRRRLVIVRYERPKPEEPIEEFDRWLIDKEGSGILRWAIAGAIKILGGDKLKLSKAQKKRVDDLLDESDSVRVFLRERLEAKQGEAVVSDDITEHYFEYCEQAGWDAESKRKVELALPDLMLELFRARRSKSIPGEDGKQAVGYRGVTWRARSEDGDQLELAESAHENGAAAEEEDAF